MDKQALKSTTIAMKPLHLSLQRGERLNDLRALMTSLALVAILLQATALFPLVTALPKPAISTEPSKSAEIIGTTVSSLKQAPVGTTLVPQITTQLPTQLQQQQQPQQQQQQQQQVPLVEGTAVNDDEVVEKTSHTNTAEKLKRGLSNFINQTSNPGTFFVPPAPQKSPPIKPVSEIGEPLTIINNDPAVEVFINRPRRLTHSRPIGGPLRWGRR